MKRVQLFLILMLIVTAGLNTVMAQGTIIIVPPATPTPVPDTDGDGLPDTNDLCPTVPGTREDLGCPVTIPDPPADADGDGIPDASDLCPTIPGTQATQGCPVTGQPNEQPPGSGSPNEPPPSSGSPDARPAAPPFVPPHLPTDDCYVTPMQDSRVNVRSAPDIGAAIIGSLLPGTVYPSLGYVMNGTDMWLVMSVYEGSTGTTGYASRSVLLASMCAEVPGEISIPTGAADGFAANPLEQPTLCYLSVGYDPATYGSAFDAQLGNEPIVYAAFYFESEPGLPIMEGTQVWGVVSIDGYNMLPPDSPLYFQTPDSAVAVTSSQPIIDMAMSGGVGTAFNLAFPNPNGGVRAPNGTTFYRLSDPDHVGNCGPIVAIDDFASATGETQGVVFVGGWGSSMYQYAFNDPDLACAAPSFTGGVFVAADDVIVDGRIITAENWSSPCFNFTEVVFERAAEGLSLNLRQTDIGETTRGGDGSTTVEYCIYVELYEVGVFNQVCYEIEIPPNCALTTSEAGVYTVVCEGDGVVELNPELDGLPALDLTVPSRETPNDPFYMELGDIKG